LYTLEESDAIQLRNKEKLQRNKFNDEKRRKQQSSKERKEKEKQKQVSDRM